MPNKEQMGELIDKWSWLLEGLGKAKYKLYKYSRIYENILQNSNKSSLKILLPLTYRVLKSYSDINISRSAKNYIDIFNIEKNDIDHMDLDSYMSLLDAVSEMIIEKLNQENISSIYRIQLGDTGESYKISVAY